MKPDVYMIGGANGAGKTTAAMALLPNYLEAYEFVNADEIARGLNPVNPASADMMAGRVMIDRINRLIEARKNFAFETTCATHAHVKTLQKCKEAGYRTNLFYIWLPSADIAIERVAMRVKEGGHHIPEETIRRRYFNGLIKAIKTYLPLVEKAIILNNMPNEGSDSAVYSMIAEKTGDRFTIIDQAVWQKIQSSI